MRSFITKYLIQTNIWVAICFTGLFIFFQMGLYTFNFPAWGIVFFGTLAIYNFSRIQSLNTLFQFKPKNKTQIFLTVIGLIGTFVCVIIRGFELKSFLYLGVLGFVSFCYNLPFSNLGLRAIPFLKLFLIAFVWAGSSIGLLLVVHHDLFAYKLLFLSVFIFVVGITIPFDIRDTDFDEKELKTIPQVIGIRNSKWLASFGLILSGLFFYLEFGELNNFVMSWLIMIGFALLLAINSNEKKSGFYYSFWMESCSFLPLLIYLALNLF